MPIVFPVLRSCKVTNFSEKVIEQLRVRVILLMEIRLKGQNGEVRKGEDERNQNLLAIVWEPSAKVTIGKAKVVVIEEKKSLLPDM